MFRNYIRIAFRTLGKNKIYSFINITGFAIGITCTLLILLWVHDELTFDAWMPKYDRVYRLMVKATYDGKINTWNANPIAAMDAIKQEHPAIVNTAITDWGNDHLLAPGNKEDRSGIKRKGMYASQSYLDIFQYPVVRGNLSTAFKDMNSIILTESTAKALFGDKDPLDQKVRMDDKHELRVTALIKDVPKNSNDSFDFLTTWELNEASNPWVKRQATSWDNYGHPIFIELSDPSEAASVEAKIADLPARHGQTDFRKEFALQAVSHRHLYWRYENGQEAGGAIEYVKMFSIVAALVLFIACVNFMNLATARAAKRAVEVGVRKSVGSRRSELMWQFIWESILTTAIAFVIGVVLAQLLLPFYNQLVSKQLSIPYLSWQFVAGSIATIFFVGMLAGSYPAFYLSAFKPSAVLKGGKSASGKSGSLPRKVLVTVQFGFSMLLIIATIVVYQQIQHVRDRDMGFNSDNLLLIQSNGDIARSYSSLKAALLQTGVVESVTKSSDPISSLNSWTLVDWPGKPSDQKVFFAQIATEYDYVKTFGLKLIAGRDFSEEFKSDSAAVIVNRAAVELMGLKDPIGTKVETNGGKGFEIVGVVENTVSGSPYEPVGPMILGFIPEWFNSVSVRMTDGIPVTESLKKVEAVFKQFSPAYPFEFRFADDAIQYKYEQIDLTGRLASIFAILTLIITGLGLFGLAAFMADQRTKEMGIRKVMGASVQQLVQLVTRDFSVLVIIAFIIASPIAWWLIDQYLQQYKYRIDVQWWIFPVTGAIALVFAVLIVSTQALRAARSNPAQSLRSE